MPRVSDEEIEKNKIWLLNCMGKEDDQIIPDERCHRLFTVLKEFCDLRAAAREVRKQWRAHTWGEGVKKAIDRLADLAGKG